MQEIETLESTLVYENRWMSVREHAIRRSDGSRGVYGVVEKKDFAIIAAVRTGEVVLVEQYRYPVHGRYWELPQGTWDSEVEDPVALARAELREETGVVAARLTHVGRLLLAYGFCTQGYNVFLAEDLEQQAPQIEPEEHGLIAKWFPLAEVEQMIRSGVIVDASTVASLGLLKLKGLL
jgi:ADP-ribose pyrophosphatase